MILCFFLAIKGPPPNWEKFSQRISYLGFKFHPREEICINTSNKWHDELLQRFDVIDWKPVSNPMEESLKLKKCEDITGENKQISIGNWLVVSLFYLPQRDLLLSLLLTIWDNITTTTESKGKTVKRILRCLCRGNNWGQTVYQSNSELIKGFVNTDREYLRC